MSSSILVTGAQGFIGRYVCSELLRRGCPTVVGIGRSLLLPDTFTHNITLSGGELPAPLTPELLEAAQDSRFYYRPADITCVQRVAELIAEFEPEVIIHLAATRREEPAERLIAGNIQGVRSLLDGCRESGVHVRRIVLGSSGGVYGIPAELPLRESSRCDPADAYGASKLAGEYFARIFCNRAGIEVTIARIFNAVGPGQEERHVCGKLASQVAGIMTDGRRPILSVAGRAATRDYIDVRDVASALRFFAANSVSSDIYNVASGIETSVGEIVDGLITIAGLSHIEIREDPGRPGDIMRHFGSIDKLSAEGFRRDFDLNASLRGVLSYYLTLETKT